MNLTGKILQRKFVLLANVQINKFFIDVKEIRKFNENWREKLYFREDLHLNKNGNLYSDQIYKDAFN